MAIPGTLLAICVSSMLGNGIWQTAVAVAVGGIAPSCRMMRATALSIRFTLRLLERRKSRV